MTTTAVEAAQAKGWRHVYFNSLTIPYWAIHVTAVVGIALTGFSWLGSRSPWRSMCRACSS